MKFCTEMQNHQGFTEPCSVPVCKILAPPQDAESKAPADPSDVSACRMQGNSMEKLEIFEQKCKNTKGSLNICPTLTSEYRSLPVRDMLASLRDVGCKVLVGPRDIGPLLTDAPDLSLTDDIVCRIQVNSMEKLDLAFLDQSLYLEHKVKLSQDQATPIWVVGNDKFWALLREQKDKTPKDLYHDLCQLLYTRCIDELTALINKYHLLGIRLPLQLDDTELSEEPVVYDDEYMSLIDNKDQVDFDRVIYTGNTQKSITLDQVGYRYYIELSIDELKQFGEPLITALKRAYN